ncbi:hypothetical protein ACIOWI_09735 [Streptomyces sp. NPDC087659]|uniref:hypothetical protein n=1 Tax=Streptomyces sp. NPDC087659 TaxID=3365801 RepID=UPI00380A27E6
MPHSPAAEARLSLSRSAIRAQLDVHLAVGDLPVRHIVRPAEAQRHRVPHDLVESDGYRAGVGLPPLVEVVEGRRGLAGDHDPEISCSTV